MQCLDRIIQGENIHAMNIRTIHYIILGYFFDGPMHGYQVYKHLQEKDGVGIVWRIKVTNIYNLLEALEKKGLVKQFNDTSAREEYPSKKHYEITKEGKNEFYQWLEEPVNHGRDIRQIFLSKLYFARKCDPDIYKKLIHAQLEECRKWVTNIDIGVGEENSYQYLVGQFRSIQMQGMIEWLEILDEKAMK